MLPTSSPRIGGVGRRAGAAPDSADSPGTAPAAGVPAGTMERFLCEGCGDVIGVYEPLVVGEGQDVRTTSRAAEPHLRAGLTPSYHRECYAALALTRRR